MLNATVTIVLLASSQHPVLRCATAILIAHVAGGTRSIRVGSGGIMLPNHAPLIVLSIWDARDTLSGAHRLGLGALRNDSSPPVRCDGI